MHIGRPSIATVSWIVACVLLTVMTFAGPDRTTASEAATGTVTGRIMIKGAGALAWGQVLFYDVSTGVPPDPDKYYRTPDISRNLDGEGRFKAELPPGRYYLGAVKRMSGDRLGIPQEGDFVFRSVDGKKLKEYAVKAGSTTDVGTIAEAVPVKVKDPAKQVITTAIEGIVNDTEGKPVEDAVVIAFVDSSLKGKSLFLSDNTGKDGKYSLRLTAGTYYLRVKNRFSIGPPEPGQIVGFYGDGSLAPVRVKDGEIVKGINFTVIVFGGRGPRAAGAGAQ